LINILKKKYLLMPNKSIKRDKLHLLHIRDAIEKIEYYVNLGKQKHLQSDELVFDAVAMQFCVIALALKNLSDSFRKKNPQIPYRKIIGMRNIISHEYHKVQKSIIWKTYKEDLPELKQIVEKSLENLN